MLRLCLDQKRPERRGADPVSGGLAFNDPARWGYCDVCAFDVAVADGLRVEHRYTKVGNNDSGCPGSGRPPKPSQREGKAQLVVSFVKLGARTSQRSYWRRMRQIKRDKARESRTILVPAPRVSLIKVVRYGGS